MNGIHEGVPEIIATPPLQADPDGAIGTYGIGGCDSQTYQVIWDIRNRSYPVDEAMVHVWGRGRRPEEGHHSIPHVTRLGSGFDENGVRNQQVNGSQGGPGGPGVLVLTIIG